MQHAVQRLGGMVVIQERTFTVAAYAYRCLKDLKYPNGLPLLEIYADKDAFTAYKLTRQGCIVTFNMLNADGSYRAYTQVSEDIRN